LNPSKYDFDPLYHKAGNLGPTGNIYQLIPDIEKFLPVSIFKLADTIPQKFKVAFN
jgi:hypothetical protein